MLLEHATTPAGAKRIKRAYRAAKKFDKQGPKAL